ncbi:MAG: hypothetical protein AVDCRST_MAG48-2430, partial [uncultured Friedmanniella sp.]
DRRPRPGTSDPARGGGAAARLAADRGGRPGRAGLPHRLVGLLAGAHRGRPVRGGGARRPGHGAGRGVAAAEPGADDAAGGLRRGSRPGGGGQHLRRRGSGAHAHRCRRLRLLHHGAAGPGRAGVGTGRLRRRRAVPRRAVVRLRGPRGRADVRLPGGLPGADPVRRRGGRGRPPGRDERGPDRRAPAARL